MTAKEYLQQIKRLDTRINLDLRELEHWRDLSSRISSVNFNVVGSPTRSTEPPFVKCLDKIMELEEKINAEIDSLIDLKAEILDCIHSLENADYQAVLEMRYISGFAWGRISSEMHYSVRWIYKLHDAAIAELQNNLQNKKCAVKFT